MPILDTLEFEPVDIWDASMLHIAGNVYATVENGPNNHGWLRTFSVDANGNFSAVIASYEFDNNYCAYPKLYHRDGSVYIIIYRALNGAAFGRIITTQINADGTLGGAIIDFLDTGVLDHPVDIIQVDGDIHAITFVDNANDAWLTTIDITAAGAIGGALINTWLYEAAYSRSGVLIQIAAGIFGILNRGTIHTVPINAAGVIGVQINNHVFATGVFGGEGFFNIAGTVYAILYGQRVAPDDFARILTISIDALGNIGAVIATAVLEDTTGVYSDISGVRGTFANNRMAVSYRTVTTIGGVDTRLDIKTNVLTITDAGGITVLLPNGWVAITEIPVVYRLSNYQIVNHIGVIDLMLYRHTDTDGFVSSVVIIAPPVVQTDPATEVS